MRVNTFFMLQAKKITIFSECFSQISKIQCHETIRSGYSLLNFEKDICNLQISSVALSQLGAGTSLILVIFLEYSKSWYADS
jgi:hypothetical protein